MTTQHNKRTAAEFFARFSAGDIPGAVDLLSADATWRAAGKPGLSPPAGRYTKEEIARYHTLMRIFAGQIREVREHSDIQHVHSAWLDQDRDDHP